MQFDEEFTARQEAQAELQKREEKIKELETEIQQLRTQVMRQDTNFVSCHSESDGKKLSCSMGGKRNQKQTFWQFPILIEITIDFIF